MGVLAGGELVAAQVILVLHLGVLGQAVGQGGEGAGGCLKASKDEDDRLAQ